MSASDVEISLRGGHGTLLVDGHDISNPVTALHFDRKADGSCQLVLDLIPGSMVVSAGAEVTVDKKTREALVALGWTPPDGAA